MVVWFFCNLVRFIFTSFVTFEVSFFQIFVKFFLTERRKLVATLCRSLRPENGRYFLIFSQKLTLIASKMVAFAEVSAVLWLALTLRVVLAPTGHGCGTHIPPKNHFLSPLKISRLFGPIAEILASLHCIAFSRTINYKSCFLNRINHMWENANFMQEYHKK